MLNDVLEQHVPLVDDYLQAYFKGLDRLPEHATPILESVNYSLFTGGKRFRPVLSLLTAQSMGVAPARVLPFAAALEMIHTYSLIHDDLPSMDNDDIRRGKPTNHKVYGEAMALLAGDALLTEAPLLVAKAYADTPDIARDLIELLCQCAGMNGMIAGQVMDLSAQGLLPQSVPKSLTQSDLEDLHQRKTGALIRAAVKSVGIIARSNDDQLEQLEKFGALLGLSFQLADDIHDYNPNDPEKSGYPKYIGVEGTRKLLEQTTEKALEVAKALGPNTEPLQAIAQYNLNRDT